MKKKNKLIICTSIFIIAIVGILIFFILNYTENTFSISEKQWMEDHKNEVIDISILNDIPIINYNGDGILFSFINNFEKELGLKFNKSAYKIDDTVDNSYVVKLVDKKDKNDILVLRDNYVLVLKNNITYNDVLDIQNLKLGILNSDLKTFKKYLNNNNELVGYDNVSDLIKSLNSDEDKIDGLVILKTLVMEDLVKNNLTISYQFDNYTKDYVISLNGDETLNSIVKKYYDKWSKDNYDKVYNNHLLTQYYTFKGVSDSEQTNVKSKKYVYGFVENGIFDLLRNSSLKGINNLILKSFSDFSGVSISYEKYNSIADLVTAYNNNNDIDIFLDNNIYDQYNIDSKTTKSGIDSTLVVVSKANNNIVIDSEYALQNKNVAIIENSNVETYFSDYKIKYKKYKNILDMFKHSSNNELLIIDLENYNYYKNSDLVDYKIDYILNTNNNYKYVINGSENTFADLYDFYINYTSIQKIISDGYDSIAYKTINYFYILIIVVILLFIVLSLVSVNKIKRILIERKKKRKVNLSKSDKLKYIDQLTSLKNRAYLNSKIDEWDNSEIYPQAIIIIDLNNISYINDNYGREEGDNVIVEAANILINSQLPNSEIIRTDGNEFLVYLVGYNEKNIISYLRSLSREFKRLSHGFGAASGYSMITDGIKTVDDAVNEATIDMKNNKEDIDY